jgi:hypothetical protein
VRYDVPRRKKADADQDAVRKAMGGRELKNILYDTLVEIGKTTTEDHYSGEHSTGVHMQIFGIQAHDR